MFNKKLFDAVDFDEGIFLAVAGFGVDAFFAVVADDADLVAGDFFVNDREGNFYAFYRGGADRGLVAVDKKESVSFERFGA